MPERRTHRGPHPRDDALFDAAWWPPLRQAVADLSWLLSRGYAEPSSLKLVGDRYNLRQRQRIAVRRCACPDDAVTRRREHELAAHAVRGRPVVIDGFNLITTVEAALAGGVLLRGRDGCVRDMASMHGNYRKVVQTQPAADAIGRTLAELDVPEAHWLLDRPVSNSGRLRTLLLEAARQHGWSWTCELTNTPDAALIASHAVVISADSAVLDQCRAWLNLVPLVLDRHLPAATVIDLGGRPA